MSIKQHLDDILDVNSDIKFNDAKDLIYNKYNEILTRSNFDYIKHLRRKKQRYKKKKKSRSGRGKPDLIPPESGVKNLLSSNLLDPDLFGNVNIKTLLKNDSISEILKNGRNKSKSYDFLSKPEIIDQGDIKHGVYWTSDMPP